MPKSPLLAPFHAGEQRLWFKLLPSVQAPHPISKAELGQPVKETHHLRLYLRSHYPKSVTIGEDRDIDWSLNQKLHQLIPLSLHHDRMIQCISAAAVPIRLSSSHSIFCSLINKISRYLNSCTWHSYSSSAWWVFPALFPFIIYFICRTALVLRIPSCVSMQLIRVCKAMHVLVSTCQLASISFYSENSSCVHADRCAFDPDCWVTWTRLAFFRYEHDPFLLWRVPSFSLICPPHYTETPPSVDIRLRFLLSLGACRLGVLL